MDISAEVAAIQAASQGSELRQPLVGALNKLNSGSLPAVTASDVGKILKVGAAGWEVGEKSGYMPAPTATMQITENDTYDVTNYASAVVNVSGSGGGSVLVTKTITENGTYDPADDNADGYSEVTVNVASGSLIDATYLPNSSSDKILVSQNASVYDESRGWGNIAILYPNNNSSGNIVLNDGALRKPLNNSMHFNLGGINKNTTVYCCLRVYSSASGNLGIIQFMYASSVSNDPNFHVRGTTLWSSVYSDDTNENIDLSNYHIIAISIDGTNKIAKFYADGNYLRSKSFNNSGRNVYFGSSDILSGGANTDIKYIGIVSECESDATIISNMQTIANKLNIA